MSDHCVNKPKYCLVKDENENEPLFMDNSDYNYNYVNNYKNYDKLTIWKTEKYDQNENCNAIFDIDFNEQANLEEKNINKEECMCINAWKQLQHSFELTDEELLRMYQLKKTIPDEIFTYMPIDLNNDDCGEDLEDFELDGEYLFTQLDELTREFSHDVRKIESTAIKKKEQAVDKPKEQALNQETANPANNQIKSVTNNNKNVNDITNVKTKPFRPNVHENTNTPNKKRVDDGTKATEKDKLTKRCTGNELMSNNMIYTKRGLQYLYTYGESYRGGIYTGHKNCVDCWVPIPKDKGWITDKFLTDKRKKMYEQVSKMQHRAELLGRLEGEKSLMDDKAAKKKDFNTKQPMKSSINIVNHFSNSGVDSDTKKTSNAKQDSVAVAAAVAATAAMEIKDAVPIMEFAKKDGKCKITMNCLTSDGKLDSLYKPIVFKLGVPKQADNSDILSSSSSLNFQFVPPETIYARNYQRACNDVSTIYDAKDLVEKVN